MSWAPPTFRPAPARLETCKDCGAVTSDPVQDGGWPPGFRCPPCHDRYMEPIFERHRRMEAEGGSLLDSIRLHEEDA